MRVNELDIALRWLAACTTIAVVMIASQYTEMLKRDTVVAQPVSSPDLKAVIISALGESGIGERITTLSDEVDRLSAETALHTGFVRNLQFEVEKMRREGNE